MKCTVNGLTEIQNGIKRFTAESIHRRDSATPDSISPIRFAFAPRKKNSIYGGHKRLKSHLLPPLSLISILALQCGLNPAFGAEDSAPFQQNEQGIVSIEAEHFHANTAQGKYAWKVDKKSDFSGESALMAAPEDKVNLKTGYDAKSPRLDYQVKFSSAGTYYVWVRGFGRSGGSNSVHVGLDGQTVPTAENVNIPVTGNYAWTDGSAHTIDIATPGVHTIHVWMRESGTRFDKLVLSANAGFVPAGTGPVESTITSSSTSSTTVSQGDDSKPPITIEPGQNNNTEGSTPFQQNEQGIVSIETEHFHANTAQGKHAWEVDKKSDYSGESALMATPEDKVALKTAYEGKSPRLDYRVKFNTAGTYYVWVRGFGRSGGSNSVHVGLNGQTVPSGEHVSIPVTGNYAWTDGLAHTIDIPAPGVHTINVWMRESGTRLDKLVLSPNAGFTPTGTGPVESTTASSSTTSTVSQGNDSLAPIAIEAEHYNQKVAQNKHNWTPSDTKGYSGEGAMMASPEDRVRIDSDYAQKSPRLDYQVKFTEAGTYYVWLRALGPKGGSNSVHIGLDGNPVKAGENITVPVAANYTWTDGMKTALEIDKSGTHTVNIWMRESGTIVDKIVLSTEPGYSPSGKGPSEGGDSKDQTVDQGVPDEDTSDGKSSNDTPPTGGTIPTGKTPSDNGPANNDKPDTSPAVEDSDPLITLSWNPIADKSVIGFSVYTGPSAITASNQQTLLSTALKTVDLKAPQYQARLLSDLGVESGKQVCFRVKSYDGNTLSDYSEAVCTVH